ncbi:MAG: phosphoribosylglycinamide formyltransferase [Myxococcota bacterium]|nr:phosphoribosylglycinamide formyltransferase [Myxococcota bacterium]MDW8361469.1 phosphoribosylglycinamide formyltransferase [Myxococcales bacterium]
MRVAVLVSGRGSNLRAIVHAAREGRCPVTVVAVFSDRAEAPAIAWARAEGLETRVVAPSDFPDRAAWDEALARAVAAHEPDVVVLAGFMRIVGTAMLGRFEGRILNVHPSLLPAFAGRDAPARALAAGVRIAGCTVHVVDAGVDTGPIVAQAAVPVLAGDDATRLHARIQRAEHELLPAVLEAIATGRVRLRPVLQAPPCARCVDDRLLVAP